MPKFIDSFVIDEKQRIVVNGEPFPFHVALKPIEIDPAGDSGVREIRLSLQVRPGGLVDVSRQVDSDDEYLSRSDMISMFERFWDGMGKRMNHRELADFAVNGDRYPTEGDFDTDLTAL